MQPLRPMCESDVPAVMAIQQACYPGLLLEDESVIRARLARCPRHAWVAEDSEGVCAYLFAYPSRLGCITPFDGVFQPAEAPDCLYLHDLAVSPRATGRGLGPALTGLAMAAAGQHGLRYSALVSVQDSAAFWARQGFVAHEQLSAEQQRQLASYRMPAVYMVRSLPRNAASSSTPASTDR